LSEQSRTVVFNAVQAARASRSLVNRIGSIERLAQRIALGAEPESHADLARVHRSFKAVAEELARFALDPEQVAALERIVAGEQALFEALSAPGLPAAAAIQARTRALADSASNVLAISYLAADRESERLRGVAETVQRRVILLAGFGTALGIALAAALIQALTRPIARLEAAILRLGDGDFAKPIEVRGPEDLRALGERLDWLRQRLAELEAQKIRFLQHLSHELKTPLTALREGAELLADQVPGPLAPPQRQVVSIMRDNSARLQSMIEALLDYQRALHAAAGLQPVPVALDTLVRETSVAHELAARANAQRLVLELEQVTVVGDRAKLACVIDNLLGNAVKYTPPEGSISVLLRAQGEAVVLEVIDSGPGVAAPERAKVFEAFFRGGAKSGGRLRGTGLGLAIAREHVEAHGGRIELVEGGAGGHFRVTLSLRPAPVLAHAA
ncbi:MAG: HAMP domain-containing sensor histidine kinase, partial [Proteobacteria bacterium]|nr:HAMP domain-containing sensor histidine kinase [Pseudomonadota bacterium]